VAVVISYNIYMGRGAIKGTHEETYWQLREPSLPTPEEDRLEQLLLRQSQMRDQADRMVADGDFVVNIRWDIPRAGVPMETDAKCDRIARLLCRQEPVISAYAAPYPERELLWVVAIVRSKPFLPSAVNLSAEIGKRLSEEVLWPIAEEDKMGTNLDYHGNVDLPSPAALTKFHDLHDQKE